MKKVISLCVALGIVISAGSTVLAANGTGEYISDGNKVTWNDNDAGHKTVIIKRGAEIVYVDQTSGGAFGASNEFLLKGESLPYGYYTITMGKDSGEPDTTGFIIGTGEQLTSDAYAVKLDYDAKFTDGGAAFTGTVDLANAKTIVVKNGATYKYEPLKISGQGSALVGILVTDGTAGIDVYVSSVDLSELNGGA